MPIWLISSSVTDDEGEDGNGSDSEGADESTGEAKEGEVKGPAPKRTGGSDAISIMKP